MKLKWFYLSFSLILSSSGLFSQVNTFNKGLIFIDSLNQESINQILEIEDGYIIAGYSYGSLNCKLIISRLNIDGDTIWLKKYGLDSTFYMPAYSNALIRTSDSNYAIAVNFYKDPDYNDRFMIIKFNSNGDTLWSNQLYTPDSTNRYCNSQGIIETMDSGFLVFGSENYLSGVMVKTNSLGDTEWIKYYGDYLVADSRQIFDVRQTPDSGYIAAGYQRNLHDKKSGDARILRFDKFGELIWDKVFGSEFEDYSGANLQALSDTNYLVVCHYTTLTSGYPHFFPQGNKLRMITISLNGTISDDYMRGNDNDHPWVSDLEIMDDGTFISCGMDYWGSISWIFNFSVENDSLFFRKINPSYSPGTLRFVNDIKGSSDGGIIACGEYTTVINSSYIRHPWIVKTDRYGCVDMGCDSNGIYILQQPENDSICKNQQGNLFIETLEPADTGNFQWQYREGENWQNIENNDTYQGVHNDTLIIDARRIEDDSRIYRCHFFNDYWSLFSDYAVVYFPDSIEIITQPQSYSVRYYDSVSFVVTAKGFSPLTYLWYHNNQVIEEERDSILTIQHVMEKDTGMYFCNIVNVCGEVQSELVQLGISNMGINDEAEKSIVRISPNPSSGMIRVRFSKDVTFHQFKLQDITGKSLALDQTQIDKIDYQIDISHISEGIYFLIIILEKDKIVRKILKIKG